MLVTEETCICTHCKYKTVVDDGRLEIGDDRFVVVAENLVACPKCGTVLYKKIVCTEYKHERCILLR